MSTLPRITCLCLTKAGRREFLEQAAECFRVQQYAERDLLIVADSSSDVEQILMPDNLPKPISLLAVGKEKNVGQKRNMGVESASGDLIAIWDDDDYSAPHRLSMQEFQLYSNRKSVTGFTTMKFTDGSSWWEFTNSEGLVFGSSLMFKREWWQKHPFPEIHIGEDAQFSFDAFRAGELVSYPDAMDVMYASIHAGNTSKKDMRQRGWKPLPKFQWR